MPEFRRSLVSSFFFKFFLHVSFQLEKSANQEPLFPDTFRSAAEPYHKPPARGIQHYEKSGALDGAGISVRHLSADMQASSLLTS